MGAKTAVLAVSDGDPRPALRDAVGSSGGAPERAEALVRRVFPGYAVAAAEGSALGDAAYPADDRTYAAVLDGVELVCDCRLQMERPSELPAHLRALGEGRRIVLHGMHSVVDWLGFAVWEDGELVRSLSLSPDGGIVENLGEPYDFERPYWAGEHPVEPIEDGPYALPFHPLDLGEDALRALLGFVVEGRPEPGHVDELELHGFSVTDPSGREQAEREAALREAMRSMRVRTYQYGADGRLHEVEP